MSCPSNQCCGTGVFFTKWSRKYAKRFQKKGLEKAQQYLLDGVRMEPLRDRTVLDIGCGVGALHLTMLREGAQSATGIDAAEGMVQKAKELSSALGLNGKVSYHQGDFVQLSPSLPQADVTVLDKVVCCYPDLEGLIDASTNRTKRIYGLTHPRNNLLMEGIFKLQIALLKLFRSGFHPFWHDWNRMQEMILRKGFRIIHQRSTLAWSVVVFQRI